MAAASVCIMVIDGNAHMRRLIGTVLGALPGAEVVEARSPIAARPLVVERNPCLVIMDWSGDHTDGVLFVHHLRRGEMGRRDIPVLALSHTLHHAVLEQALAAGIDDVIAKPISAMEIIERAGALVQFDRRRSELGVFAAAE